MKEVYVVQHIRDDSSGNEDTKFIGVYSTHEKAEETVAKFKFLPGFICYPDGFDIQRYSLDKDH